MEGALEGGPGSSLRQLQQQQQKQQWGLGLGPDQSPVSVTPACSLKQLTFCVGRPL